MTTEIFSVREGHLISLAASVAAGCLPCAGYYIERASQAGVRTEELREAIGVAEAVRKQATDDLLRRVRSKVAQTDDEPGPIGMPEGEMAILLSLSAAYAVNSHRLVTCLLDAARAGQLRLDKVLEAVQVARGVRNMAIAVVDRCIERASGGPGHDEPASCVCK